MSNLIVFVIGFAVGVFYMNGSLDEVTGAVRKGVNTAAETVVEATEPTAAEVLEEKYKVLEQEVIDSVRQ